MKLLNSLLPILLTLSILVSIPLSGQQILLDKPVRAGELILFPLVGNESNYYYLADKPRLAFHNDGNPQFSFVRYVKNEGTDASQNDAITQSTTGGGIVHALVELSVTDEQIRDAERALQRLDGDGQIIGPVVFKSGTVSLVSSVAQPNGETTQQIVGLGSAPILENQRSAVSVQLNQLGSKILWETFNTPTPDFSFNFEMEVEGYLSPKRVLIEADFERIYKHQTFEAAATTPVLAAEINIALDELFDSGAIRVTQIGSDEQLEKLKETAYNQLVNLMFDKVGGTGVPELNQLLPSNEKSMLDRATEMLNKAREETREENQRIDELRRQYAQQENRVRQSAQGRARQRMAANGREHQMPQGSQRRQEANSEEDTENNGNSEADSDLPERQPMPNLAVAVSYRLKQVKRTGSYRIDLNKYTETTRTMPFAYNPGNVKGQCEACFLEVNLDDPLMKQREINASIGGINSTDFEYINFVNIIMNKEHQNGQETVDELKIDKSQFDQTGNFFKMLYGWKGDDNREQWLEYQYRTMWSFAGGNTIETDWEKTEFGSIALNPPVVKKPIYIEVDPDFVFDEEVRGIEIKLYTQIEDNAQVQTVNLKTNKEELSRTVEVLLPREKDDYEYDVTFFLRGKPPVTSQRQQSNYGRIDIYEVFN